MSINKRMDEVRELDQRGDRDAALNLLMQLINEHPDEAGLWSLYGSLYARKGDYNQAIENINKAINLDPKNSTFYFHRGRYNLKLGNMLEAIGDLTEALNSDNCNDVTFTQQLYFHRAEAFIKLSKKEEALSDLSYIPNDYQTWTFKLRSKADLTDECNSLSVQG